MLASGDSARTNGHSTDFAANLGHGHLFHTTATGEDFRSSIEILGCHSNTGEIADLEGTGHFRGSDTTLQVFAHIEDRTRLGELDYYSVGIFNGTTLVYTAAGQVVDGDFRVTVVP